MLFYKKFFEKLSENACNSGVYSIYYIAERQGRQPEGVKNESSRYERKTEKGVLQH